MTERPPLGVVPEWVHEREANLSRVVALLDAIRRYAETDEAVIPEKWFVELARRTRRE